MSKTKKDLYRKIRKGKVLKSNEFRYPKGWIAIIKDTETGLYVRVVT